MNFKVLALTIVAFLLAMGTAGIALGDGFEYTYEDDLNDSTCAQSDCHADIAANYSQSLHYTYRGIINEWNKGVGEDFDFYWGSCLQCHGDNKTAGQSGIGTRNCTSCHVENNETIHGEDYKMTMEENCQHCHKKRPGLNFVGKGSGTNPPPGHYADIHYSEYGFVCWDCHKADELHGMDPAVRDAPNQRLAVQFRCEDCHNSTSWTFETYQGGSHGVSEYNTSSRAHEIHDGELDCSACHAEWYQYCGECHMNPEGGYNTTNPSYDRFYLGRNHEGEWGPFYNMTIENNETGEYVTHWVERSPHTVNKTHDCDFCHGNDEVLYAGDKDDKVMITGGALLSVGGITIPINVVELVLPYIVGSLMLVVPIAGVIVAARRRK